jgi:hypothetical protein
MVAFGIALLGLIVSIADRLHNTTNAPAFFTCCSTFTLVPLSLVIAATELIIARNRRHTFTYLALFANLLQGILFLSLRIPTR